MPCLYSVGQCAMRGSPTQAHSSTYLPPSLSLYLSFSLCLSPSLLPLNFCHIRQLISATSDSMERPLLPCPSPSPTHAPVCAPTIKLLPLPQRCRFDQRRLCVFFLYIFYFISCVSSSFFFFWQFRVEKIFMLPRKGRGQRELVLTFGYLHAFALLRLI